MNELDLHSNLLKPVLMFKGTLTQTEFDKIKSSDSTDYRPGDVIYNSTTGYTYIKAADEWDRVEPYFTLDDNTNEKKFHKEIIVSCKHCGASLPLTPEAIDRGWIRCSYCRSMNKTFEWRKTI